jgi:hypothetical protein
LRRPIHAFGTKTSPDLRVPETFEPINVKFKGELLNELVPTGSSLLFWVAKRQAPSLVLTSINFRCLVQFSVFIQPGFADTLKKQEATEVGQSLLVSIA